MSGKIMGQCYDYILSASERTVLQALADHADHDGAHAWSSTDRLAWKIDTHVRTVQRILRRLEKRRVLVPTAKTSAGCTVYRIDLTTLDRKPPFRAPRSTRPPVKGGILPGGGGNSPPRHRATPGVAPRCHPRGGIAVPPKPSIAVQLAAAAAAGGILSLRGDDLSEQWLAALGTDSVEVIAQVFAHRRPNGSAIRMPSSYTDARDRWAAARAAADAAKTRAQVTAADADQAARLRRSDARVGVLLAAAAARTPPKIPQAHADQWKQIQACWRGGTSGSIPRARLRHDLPAYAAWEAQVLA